LTRRRSSPLALFLTLAAAAGGTHARTARAQAAMPPPAPAVNAQTELAAGDKAARAKDWQGALDHYQAALRATPSWRAQLGVADALFQLGRLGESYEQYDDAQKTYGTRYGPGEKNLVNNRIKDLTTKTGWVSIRVGEAGADVVLDGKSIGTSPVPALIRVATGPHDVKVTKAGLTPFAAHAEVTADGKSVVEVALAPEVKTGHVTVHATGQDILRVMVDGVDVGATPWEGDLPPGAHQVGGRSSTATSPAQSVDVTLGGRFTVDLTAASTAAHVQVRTSDGKGNIYVDGVIKGEGTFAGDVTPGPHTLVVTREGYERFEKAIPLKPSETEADTVTLKPVAAAGGVVTESEHPYQGLYGGFAGLFVAGVGSQGTELDTNCSSLGADRCQGALPLGGGGFGYVGYTWDPVGFEVVMAGGWDQMDEKATFSGQPRSGTTLPMASPGRTERFTFGTGGGLVAVRARAAFQNGWLRGTLAGGVGASYHVLLAQREAHATDGTDVAYAPSPVSYISPVLSLEAAAQIRLGKAIALSVGLEMWADSASISGQNSWAAGPLQPFDVAPPGSPAPAAHQYHMATGPQVRMGPFLGLQFGP
jgi:hypothetical protein